MKKQFLRVLSILLSLALFLGIVPTAALTVLAEAVGDVLTKVESVTVGDIEVTPDNISYRIEYTGAGENPLWSGLTWDTVHSWTQEDLDSFTWEIHGFVYDEDYNEVEVTEGHFEYLWCYDGEESYGGMVSGTVPFGMTQGQWQTKADAYWENYPDDYEGLGLLDTVEDKWTSDTDVPMFNTYHELTGLPGDFLASYWLRLYIRYVSETGEVVMSPYGHRAENVYIDGEIIPVSVEAIPVNWKYGGVITGGTVKAAVGQTYTPVKYLSFYKDAEGYTYPGGSEMMWVLLRDGVTAETYTSDPSQYIPVGMDEETWDSLRAEYGDDHDALYNYLFNDLYLGMGNGLPLYTTEGLTTGEISWDDASSNLEDYSEYTIAPITSSYCTIPILDENGDMIGFTEKYIYGTGAPVTVVPVEPGQDGAEENLPVFREASPLPEEYIAGIDPDQNGIMLECDAHYGSVPLSYQWYRSETPDYNGVAIVDGSGREQTASYFAAPPDARNLDKTYYYYCEYSFTNINGVKETYYTTITKMCRKGALAIDITVTPGELYMGDLPDNTDNFLSHYLRFSNNTLPIDSGDYDFNKRSYSAIYAYQSKGSDSVLSAWIEPSTGIGKFKYSDYITYQWYKSDTIDYTTGTPVGDLVTISDLEQFSTTRTSVNGLRTYPDFNEVNQYANIHIDCPTDEVGEFYMTVVLKNYYTDERQVQHVYETYSTCRVTTFEKNEDLYHVSKDGMLDGYNGHESVMTIPAEVNGVKVTSLDRLAQPAASLLADKDIHHYAGARKVILPEGLTTVSYGAFFRLYTLEEVVFSSTITTIETLAFADTGRIKNLVLPAHITTFQPSAFRHARVEQITFDENVWPSFKNAFYDLDYLTTVILPANATGAIDGAFYDCTMLVRVDNYENINYDRDDPSFIVTLKNDFFGCPAYEYIKQGVGGCDGNFTYILNEDGASWCITEIWGDYLEHVTIPATYKGLPVTVLGRGTGTDGASNMLNARLVKWPEYLKSVTIPDTITTINNGAFEDCVNLETFNFHKGITCVGATAFRNCHRLSSDVVLADGAKVYEEAFVQCYAIKKVNAPGAYLARYSFDYCFNLESITDYKHLLPEATGSDGSYGSVYTYDNFLGSKLFSNYGEAVYKYRSPEEEGAPLSAEKLATYYRRSGNIVYRVYNNKAVPYRYADVDAMEITIPSTINGYKVETVDRSLFYHMLTENYTVVFEEGIVELTGAPLSFDLKIGAVTLPESMTHVGKFFEETLLKEVHIPANLTNFSFRGCELLEKVTFAEGSRITEIMDSAFYQCKSLSSVEFEKLTNLQTIGRVAFYGTVLSVVDLRGCTSLTLISDGGFEEIPHLDEIYLPDNLEEIGEGAFAAPLRETSQDSYIETLHPLSVLVLPKNLKIVRQKAFYRRFMDNMENEPFQLDLPDSLEVIEPDAFGSDSAGGKLGEKFQNNLVLSNEKLPASLKKFGTYDGVTVANSPFANSQIDTLVFQPAIEEIAIGATASMPKLTKIVFEADPRTGSSNLRVLRSLLPNGIGEVVGWDNLQKLEIVGNSTSSGFGYGDWKYDKAEYTLPSTVRTIESLGNAFATVIIPDGVQSINSMSCISTPENPRKIIAYGTSASAPKLADKWLRYDHSSIEENGYELAPLYCYTGSAYHEWAVEHDYPYVLMDDGTNTITLKFYDSVLNQRQVANTYFKSIVWKDKNGNVVGNTDLLTNVTPGEEYSYELTFYDNKSWDYCLPFTSGTVTAIEGGASVNLTISPLKNITLTGTFVNQAEPGFTVQVQSRQSSTSKNWYTVSTLTMADLGVDGSFSLQMPVKDVRLVMSVTGVTKLTQTEKIYLSRSGRVENGVMDLGEVKMDYKGAESSIRVNGDLSRVPNLYLKTEDGTSYAVVTTAGYLHIREAIKAGVKAGETVTLYSAYENGYSADDYQGPYYIDPVTFTVPYEDDGTILDVEVKHAVRIDIAPVTEGVVYIFDESGKVVIEAVFDTYYIKASGSYYILPGKYTMVAVSRPRNVSWKFKMLADFEALGVAEDNYIREEFTVEAGAHKVIECTIPAFNYNDGSVVTSVWVEYSQYDPYTGLAPVYVQYNDANAVDGNYVVRIRNMSSTEIESSFAEIEGKYAFGDNVVSAKVEFTVSEDQFSGDNLLVTLDASQAIFCFYAPMDGRRFTVYVDAPEEGEEQVEEFLTCCYITMPEYEFSLGPMPEVTDQDHGEVSVLAPADLRYKAVVYVDDTAKEYERKGSTSLPYSFKTYTDGASEHTVQVVIYSLGGQLLWQSNVYTIRHDRKYNEMSQPQKIDITYAVGNQSPARGAVYFNTGVINPPVLTIYQATALDGYVIKHPVEMRYSLTMSNPDLIIGETVTLVVYFCKDSPYTIDVNLAFNPATGTFDGKLEWEANTFSILEMPYGFDLQYTCESVKSEISPTFRKEQAEAALAEREALMAMVGKQYTSFDLEKLQKDFDADETLTPTQREELMDYAAWLNEGIQLLNSMSGSSSTADFQTSLAEIQKIWTDLMANMEIISLADDPPTAQELLDEGYTYCELNGMPMYGFSSDVSTTIVYLDELAPENSFMLMVFGEMSTFSSEGDDDSIVDDMFKQLMAWINTGLGVADEMMQDAINYVEEFKQWLEKYDKVATGDNYYWNEYESALKKNPDYDSYKEAVASKEQLQAMQKELKQNGLDKRLDELHQGIKEFRKLLSANDYKAAAATAKTLKAIAKPAAIATKTLPGGIGTAIGIGLVVLDAGMVAVDAYETMVWVDEQQARIQNYYNDYWKNCHKEDCYDIVKAKKLLVDSEDAETWFWIGASMCYVSRVATMVGDAIASVSSSVNLLAGTAIGAGTTFISMIFDTSLEEIKDNTEKDYTNIYRNMIRALPPRCIKDCPSGGGGGGGSGSSSPKDNNPPKEPDQEFPAKNLNVRLDPSGYVYEAVASNRIEGATAKVYYLDENGNEVYWEDAAVYDEVNPQITDVNGKYGWMVPIGKWKVRVTKDGYYDADSTKDPAADENGWLPVPPPQTAVHIGMVSKAAPVIDSVHVAEDKMQVIFSQYMDIAHLMSSDYLLRVFADGAQVPVKLEFADAEVSPTKEGVYYGRILNITRTDGQQFVGEDITLVVNGDVRNYAGTAMGTDYNSGKMSVGQVADALSHSYPNRLVMAILDNVDVALQVVDTQGKPMAGVEVTMKTAVGDFLTVNNTTAVSDENGRVVFAVSGRAAGTEFLTFTTANGITAEMEVRVDTTTVATLNKPTANLSDYSVVDCGTQLIISTNVENGIIYYTTNDTCPCTESENRQIYTGPIDLTESAFYRIAVWTEEDGYSERLNLHLTVEHDYAEDGVTCNRCGSSEGDDPIVEDIITFDGYSVSEDVNGLAFRFTIDVTGMTQKGTTAVYDNAKVMYNGQEYSLVGMGAIVSNDADAELIRESADGVRTTDIFAKYLWSLDEDSASYAVRVIDIPENGKDTTVYARAYFVIEVEGEQVVVYSDDVAEQTYNGVLNG